LVYYFIWTFRRFIHRSFLKFIYVFQLGVDLIYQDVRAVYQSKTSLSVPLTFWSAKLNYPTVDKTYVFYSYNFFNFNTYIYIHYTYMVEIFRIVKFLFENPTEMAEKIHGQVQDLWKCLMMLSWFLIWRIYQLQLITKSCSDMNHKWVYYSTIFVSVVSAKTAKLVLPIYNRCILKTRAPISLWI